MRLIIAGFLKPRTNHHQANRHTPSLTQRNTKSRIDLSCRAESILYIHCALSNNQKCLKLVLYLVCDQQVPGIRASRYTVEIILIFKKSVSLANF